MPTANLIKLAVKATTVHLTDCCMLVLLWCLAADLVAYWDFNAGAGYTIKDATNHGHDLIASQPPRWEVVRWLSTCGNGVVEGQGGCAAPPRCSTVTLNSTYCL